MIIFVIEICAGSIGMTRDWSSISLIWSMNLQWIGSFWRKSGDLTPSSSTGRTLISTRLLFLTGSQVDSSKFSFSSSKCFTNDLLSRFIRIAPDGRISFSQRLTISAKCKMNLQKFPLDSQVCPLQIGSFGHPSTDIIYKWADKALRYLLALKQQTTTNSATQSMGHP